MDKWNQLKVLLKERIEKLRSEFEMDRASAVARVLEDMESLEHEEDSK